MYALHFRVDNVQPLCLNYCVNVTTMSSWQAGELGLMNEALRACASVYMVDESKAGQQNRQILALAIGVPLFAPLMDVCQLLPF